MFVIDQYEGAFITTYSDGTKFEKVYENDELLTRRKATKAALEQGQVRKCKALVERQTK